MVNHYRHGTAIPSEDRVSKIARALGCRPKDLFNDSGDAVPAMLPIAQWAQREQIPLSRAKNLFALGLLKGAVGGDKGKIHLVPANLRAPLDSKRLITEKRRPSWAAHFCVNLHTRMAELRMLNHEMAEHTNVGQSAVTHWRSGRGYPKEERLPLIAQKLGWSMERLLAEPDRHAEALWLLQHKPRNQPLEHAA
jgi:transcriptional regulator with XRE-family HTH domain